jgi:hypothetical protein
MARNASLSSLLRLPLVAATFYCCSVAISAENSPKTSQYVNLLLNNLRAAGNSSANLTASVEKPSRFGFGLWTFANVDVKSMDEGNPDTQQFARLTALYKFNDTQSIGWMQEFWYKFATGASASGSGREAHSTLDDGGLQYLDSRLAILPFDWKLALLYRQYLPIGEKSRFVTGRQGYEQAAFTFSKTIGRVDLAEYVYGTYFNQTQDYHYSSGGSLSANPDYEFDQYFYIGWNLTPYFVLVNWIGSEHVWMRGVPEKGVVRNNDFYNETGFILKPSKTFAFTGTLLTDAPVDSQIPFMPYSPLYTHYRLYLTLSI